MSEQTPAEAGAAGAREDACRDYQSSLEDLTFNSKPHINMLTILAEENLPFAKEIVSLIEAQTAKAPSSEKLPVMYLMDSIVKNVGREYLTAFTKNLVATFICVFEKVDENTRKSLFKLRSTWDEIFPLKKLYALDVRVNSLDPAWPIKPLPPNVNTSSIHVNPKFLNKSPEEPSTPGTVVSSPSISTPPIVPDIQKNLTQEQLIRQQLLAKQKQLLELQQKKLELELEQAKAQLAVSLSVQQETSNLGPGSAPSKLHVSQIPPMAVKAPHQVPVQSEKSRPGPSLQIQDLKGTNRDPRLNRISQHSHGKDQSHRKEFLMNTLNQSDTKTSKTIPSEKLNSSKQEKSKSGEKITKKELDQLDSKSKSKSKSPSPLKNKLSHTKDLKNQESESMRLSDMNKRDPRLKKHLQDKTDGKDDDVKEKRKTAEKKDKDEHMKSSEHRLAGSRNKIINGIVQKQDTITEESEKQGTKPGRSSTRKRSRSRSPKSRSPIIHSPKRRDRRSPKRRQRSMSPTSTPKAGKIRQSGAKQSHMEEFTPPSREDRNAKRSTKQDIRDPRRMKKTEEERPQETTNQHSTKSGTEPKENVENWQSSKSAKRWKSGWEENKSLQQVDEHSKPPHLRHRESWSSTKGILSPRAPKQQQHRLSVDANLQIPKELTLASKRELLQKTSERLASGEITQDDFLVVVHQIRQLFQYQEGKHRCNVRDSPTEENKGGLKKKPLLSDAELTYYEHKAKLKRTQVQHSFPRLDLLDPDIFDYPLTDALLSGIECEPSKSKHASRNSGAQFDRKEQFSERARRLSPISGSRTYAENLSPHEGRRRHDEQVSAKGVREEQRSPFNDRFPLKRPRYEDSDKPFVDSPASRFAGLDTNQRLTALAEDRPLFDGPSRPSVARDGPTKMIFEGPNKLSPRIDGPPTPASLRFDGSPGQMGGGGPLRFEGPQGQLGGTRFDNHPSQRLESVSFNQTGPYNDPPGNAFNAPSQGLQFQRHEQIFDSPQGPNFNGPHGPGNQSFSNPLNRASGHYFDEKNLQSSQFGNFGNIPAPMTVGNIQASQQVLSGVAQPVAFGQGQQFLPVHPQNPGFVQNPSGALPKAYPDNHLSQVDVNELFSKLLKTGILKLSQTDSATTLFLCREYMENGIKKFVCLFLIEEVSEVTAQPPPEEEEDQNEDQDVPDLTNFTVEELKQRYDSVINRLYTGIQCYSCGMRFTTSQTDVYADHLDWHYRQNRTEKDVSRKVTHRRWYYSLTDWIEFEEIADLEERAKSQFFEKVHEEVVLKTQEAAKEKEFQSVPAGPAGAVESCEICQEQFEQYWDEEEEEWHLKNAIRVDGKIYHPSCYEDYQNTSSFDCTPSPSKTPVENPLNIMLNIVKNELQEPCESPKVKEERIDTPPACTEESIATPSEIKTENDTVESV
ncbi:pre-mRNA cleavage complex 2 protein Pcf11 isoform X9 [Pan troglodytes]|uniref:pre-mRNA cleavage complex 2 protein Pcf11 isoform X9 n=1 Tax=Pan troglodytes TaxID=9598 RepID=UPI0023F0F0ED|nr:pre-mRNA cleavage complex 2 protein Pcf11 isoform X11 [Pan troglodytes]